MLPPISAERQRRLALWEEVKALAATRPILPADVKRLGLHRGQQGIFRDQPRTSAVAGTEAGVAVGVLHTGRLYSDDLSAQGVIYHYPNTSRGNRDRNEIASLKACGKLGLPLFVIIKPEPTSPFRKVRLGWVQDYDDGAQSLLIAFSESEIPLQQEADSLDTDPFDLRDGSRKRRLQSALVRPNQWRFRFDVLKRYGARCAVCTITHPDMLDAAHLCPVAAGGSDDARNGLVFCLNHHRAYDKGLFRIHSQDLEIRSGSFDGDPAVLGITRLSIRHLARLPHPDALAWAWENSECVVEAPSA